MKLLLVAAVFALTTGAPALASERFAPGNPTFSQFEATCRVGNSVDPTCEGSLLDSYATKVHLTRAAVKCDDKAFWRVKDTQDNDRVFAVLPWQYGVEALVAEPGVCKSI